MCGKVSYPKIIRTIIAQKIVALYISFVKQRNWSYLEHRKLNGPGLPVVHFHDKIIFVSKYKLELIVFKSNVERI